MSTADATLRMILLGEDRSASKALKGVGDSAEKSESKVHKLSKTAGLLLVGGLAAAGAAAVDFTKRAAEDQKAQDALAQTLKNTAGATKGQIAQTEDWITKQGELYGVTDDDLRPALQRLAEGTHSVAKAQGLASLAMDVSAGTGRSLKSVSEALLRAQNGSVSGLSRYGIATKDASGKTLSFDKVVQGMSKTFSGQAAKAAETTAGKQKILATQIGELKEKIGYELLPVISSLVGFLIKMVTWVSNNTKTVGILVGVIGTMVAIIAAVNFVTKAWAAYQAIATAATVVWTNAQAALNFVLLANPIGLIILAIVALVAVFILAYKKSETFRNIVNGAFHAVAGAAKAVFGWIKGHWPLLLAILAGPIGLAVLLIVKNWGKIKAATSAVWDAIKSIVKGAWNGIIGVVKGQIQVVLNLVKGAANGIKNLGGVFLSAGKSLIGKLFDGILAAARSAGGFVGSLVDSIKNAINSTLHLPLVVSFDKGPIHIHATVIPAFASGVRNFGGGLALVGERGPEVVNLPRGSDVYPHGTGPGRGGDLGTVTVDLRMDGRSVQKVLLQLKRQNGNLALGLG